MRRLNHDGEGYKQTQIVHLKYSVIPSTERAMWSMRSHLEIPEHVDTAVVMP